MGQSNLNHGVARQVLLCQSAQLVNSGDAVSFEVLYEGRSEHGFVVRFEGQVYAYLNRCAHIPMEMDYVPNRFFDISGQWLICATHGALYNPTTGACRAGPCRGGLIAIALTEHNGSVYWHTAPNLQPIEC